MGHVFGRFLCVVLGCVALSCVGRPARAQDPLLTIVYSSNSLGQFNACQDCSAKGTGGLARRAAVYRDMRAGASSSDSLLFISGGWEFRPWKQRNPQPKALAGAFIEGYEKLGYDLLYMVPEERALFDQAGASLPEDWITAGEVPVTRLLERAGLHIGVVVFPRQKEWGEMDAEVLSKSIYAVSAIAQKADLVIGLSPWGETLEDLALKAGIGVDILIGSGRGMGVGVKEAAGGRALWVRPMFDGREVQSLDIHGLPENGLAWREGIDYRGSVVVLDGHIRGIAAISSLFSWF